MTIVFSVATPYIIVMTADSAITLEFENSREYQVGRKSYFYPGVGCVMTWGPRDHNLIGHFPDISAAGAPGMFEGGEFFGGATKEGYFIIIAPEADEGLILKYEAPFGQEAYLALL